MELVGEGSGCHFQGFRLAPQAEIGPGALNQCQGCWGARRSEDAVENRCCKTPVSSRRGDGQEGELAESMEANSYHHANRGSFECRN